MKFLQKNFSNEQYKEYHYEDDVLEKKAMKTEKDLTKRLQNDERNKKTKKKEIK